MKSPKSTVIPIPVEGELNQLIRDASVSTGLKLADVMRQGLRHGVPAMVQRLNAASVVREPKCLNYLDDYPRSKIHARDLKKALREKLAKKYGRTHR